MVDELEEISELGYEWIWFSYDCFTLPETGNTSLPGMKRRGLDLDGSASQVILLNLKKIAVKGFTGINEQFDFPIESKRPIVFPKIERGSFHILVYTQYPASLKTCFMRQLLFNEKVEFALSPKVSIRVYADCRPHALQTMRLQKGCVLVFNGRELVEEGLGIGAPVCLYRDGARFSLNAVTFVDNSETDPSVTKIYDMNAIESKRFRGASIRRESCAERFLRALEKGYRGIRRLHVGATMMLDVVSMVGLRNEYVESCSKGQISVSYERSEGALRVTVNFESLVTEGLKALVIGNEQGGRLFAEYSDSFGGRLEGREIEPWRTTSAEWATLSSPEVGVGFKLRRPDGWRIVRGREVVDNRISWSGLNLAYDGIPTLKTLEYRIETFGDA